MREAFANTVGLRMGREVSIVIGGIVSEGRCECEGRKREGNTMKEERRKKRETC